MDTPGTDDDRTPDEANEQTLRLLEQTHDFPCPYLFKVIGIPDDNFVGRVLAAVRSELPADAEPPFSSRESSKGRHISVSIEPTIAEGRQIMRIYDNLKGLAGIEMVF